MCDQSETNYSDGEVVWVKLGACWWPGEVIGPDNLPSDLLSSFRKPPIAVVKFFLEDTYEYVKNASSIYSYNCSRKTEFIKKGLDVYRNKHGLSMDKFPEDVIRAETATGGDIEILTRDEFQEVKKEKQDYTSLFGTPKKTPGLLKKGRGSKTSHTPVTTPFRKATLTKNDYKVHILVQGLKPTQSQTPETTSIPSTSCIDSDPPEESPKPPVSTPATPVPSGTYSCHACPFTTTRLNVMILHNKTHSATFVPYTPSPVKKKSPAKSALKSSPNTSKSTSNTQKTIKVYKPRTEKSEKLVKKASKKRASDEKPAKTDTKKPKTNAEIKSSLLADWDDGDEESFDQSSEVTMAASPEIAIASDSPAVPTSAELPCEQVPKDIVSTDSSRPENLNEKEPPNDSKYEFCEDEDWSLEADVGRKIPRVKNPAKRKEDAKSLDDNEVAREVAELLNKTTVPELPSVPELLKVEENFPEPSIVKSPDKNPEIISSLSISQQGNKIESQTSKPTIFKTKTFFRSRHSRSQDAIGKYVAEQLNAERIDLLDSEINGSELSSSPKARESPPIEYVKVARLAPKIQLKKMKAEAAQLQEVVKCKLEQLDKIPIPVSTTDNFLGIPKKENKTKEIPSIQPKEPIKRLELTISETFMDNTKLEENNVNHEAMDCSEDVIVNENKNLEHGVSIISTSNEKCDLNNEVEVGEKVNKNYNFATQIEDILPPTGETVTNVDSSAKATISETVQVPKDNLAAIAQDHNIQDSSKSENISKVHHVLESEPVQFTQDMSYPTQEIRPIEGINFSTTKTAKKNHAENKNVDVKKVSTSAVSDIFDSPTFKIGGSGPETKSDLREKNSFKQPSDTYISESTASAVDALLSVSREADRVTKIISDDPPDDLFEDDYKDNSVLNINGLSDASIKKNDSIENNVKIAKSNVNNDENQAEKHEIQVKNCEIQAKNNETDIESNKNLNAVSLVINNDKSLQNEAIENGILNYSVTDTSKSMDNIDKDFTKALSTNIPTESDLQIAEALINLPSTAIQINKSNEHQVLQIEELASDQEHVHEEIVHTSNNLIDHNNIYDDKESNLQLGIEVSSESRLEFNDSKLDDHFETEREKSENLNAAQSLVQMSESIEHNVSIAETEAMIEKGISNPKVLNKDEKKDLGNTVEQKIALLSSENTTEANGKMPKFETTSSKLLKILEEPSICHTSLNKANPNQQSLLTGNEKILNFDVEKSSLKAKTPKQKIIIRRTTTNKNLIKNFGEVTTPDKIILSRNTKPTQDGTTSIQTYTITTPLDTASDSNTIIIQPKLTKISKPPPKLQKIKHTTSLIVPSDESNKITENLVSEDAYFDINSMPVILSDDILTPENIEKMPLVMSDGNIITNPQKLVKMKPSTKEVEKIAISAMPTRTEIKTYNKQDIKVSSRPELKTTKKAEIKTLLINPVSEGNKVTTPNILSKSSKARGSKPMLIIDKSTGKQKIIMTKAEPFVKEVSQVSTKIQPVHQSTGKTEKFIILPTPSSPRTGRTQKIVIDPQSGKAHVLVTKGPDAPLTIPENKPVSAKLIPSASDTVNPGNTVMIITNAQGTQSRIVLTPEHEKILFPNKQQPNMPQLKAVTQRITSSGTISKPTLPQVASAKPQTKIMPKQKSAVITSKGQLIVGGSITTTAQNINSTIPELRPALKRIAAAEPKKSIQTIQKTTSEPLIFLQQKSGAVMQLTTAQFEHLQRTGQIVQKPPTTVQQKIIVQKSVTIPPPEHVVQKQKVKRTAQDSPTSSKKVKHEVAIAPSPAPVSPVFSSLSKTITPSPLLPVSTAAPVPTNYPELENFEELLPSTAIVRQQPETATVVAAPAPEPVVAPPPVQFADGQLLAVPGENFGGPQGSFYLCIEDNGTLTSIDNRPLILENNQLVPMAIEPLPLLAPQPERRDILEAALANSDVFHADSPQNDAPDFRDLNANVSVHCRVSETSTTLNQPIMTPIEVPSKAICEPTTLPSNLEDGLAVIGVTPQTVPTSLELPITVTDPRIAPKTTDPLSNTNYSTTLLSSPNADIPFMATEEVDVSMGPISMPLLTDDESVGKSMPLLTDDIIAERTVSSIDSTVGSPSSIDVRESETEDGSQWSQRRLLTPGSDTSETSAEIPLQPSIQISVNDLSRGS